MYRTELATICRLHKGESDVTKKINKNNNNEELTIAEVNQLARDAGMTYGKYVAMLYEKKRKKSR